MEGDEVQEPAPSRRRRRWTGIALAVAVVLVVIGIASWDTFVKATEGPEPGAFYTPPDPLPTGPPGTIIRTEPLGGPVPDGAQAWRVLYLSTGLQGEPIAVSGAVFAPAGPAPAGGRPVVAWAHGTTGIVDRCAPSIERAAEEIPSLEQMLQAGYVVTATDYAGLGTPGVHPYLVGTSEGYAVLDSIRAAQALPEAGAADDVAIWGHSQGGHAAIFAGDLAPAYAPELKVAGVAAAAPASELADLFSRDLDTIAGKVLTSMAVVSWSDVYPDLSMDQVMEKVAIPFAQDVAGRCIVTTDQSLAVLPDVTGFRLGFAKGDPTKTPPWDTHFRQNSTPTTKLGAPLLVAQGAKDTIVWPEVTEPYVQALCQAGTTVDLRIYPNEDHFGVRLASAPVVLSWMADRFAGATPPSTCS